MGGKEKGKAEITEVGLRPEAKEWVRDNVTAGFSAQYNQLKADSEKYAKTMNNEFKSPNERAEAAEKYKETLLKTIENLDSGIAQLKELKGNFMLFFGDQEKEFDKYAASIEKTRASMVGKLWEHTEKELGEGAITKITIPVPEGVSLEGLKKKYPDYRFESISTSMESEETSLIITMRPSRQIDISANFEGDTILRGKPRRKIDEKFE